jgi:pimeloyl-ACP methyl ester carboxylesterase
VNKLWMWAVALGAVASAHGQAATSPSIEVFASGPRIEGVSISPDGRGSADEFPRLEQRNPDLFRCAVSIAGLSDLGLLIDEGYRWLGAKVVQKQIGTDPAKLKRDSPRQHATEFKVPVLLLHGDRDAQAPYAQSEVMDTALTHAGKPHRFVTIHDADHQLSAESDRVTMLREVEAFLAERLGVAAPIPP